MTAVVAPARRLIIGLALLCFLAGAEPASARTPILVVKSSANHFSSYVPEIMRAEGLNGFTLADISQVNGPMLAGYDVVVLGDIPISPAHAAAFGSYVAAGGNLIALSPDPQLAGLLGLARTGATLQDRYLAINAGAPLGTGLGTTIQYHGAADLYMDAGAARVATLYSNAANATGHPAVSLRAVGTAGGEAAAFTFDLARSVVLTRQGNPAWVGMNRDEPLFTAVRTNDLFYPNWVDVSRMHIPQADELQRLFANLITYMNRDRTPVPRFWYLPRDERAAVVMTGDDHNETGTAGRFERYKAESPPGCSVANWECVRSTSYVYQNTAELPNALAASYQAQGFEVALHPGDGGCIFQDELPVDYAEVYDADLMEWKASYPSIASPVTSRFHCVAWTDWITHAKVQAERGIRLDTNYYHFPSAWGAHPGFMTGSGEIMKFADIDGTTINLYQANTHINDEWTADREDASLTTPAINALLNWATGPQGYYGLFTMNMHTDDVESAGSDAILQAAKSRGVPIISARQALQWVQSRDGSSFTDFTWSAGRLGFTVGTSANGLRGMVPIRSANGALISVTRNGVALPLTPQRIKGVDYAFFTAAPGRYEARYPAVGPGGSARPADRTAPRLKLKVPKKIKLRRLLRKGLVYRATCSEPCRLRGRLAAKIGKRKVTLAIKRRRLAASRRMRVVAKVRPKPGRRLRRARPRPRRLALRNTATDAAGNSRSLNRRVRLTK